VRRPASLRRSAQFEVRARVVLVLGCMVAAYHFSLLSLVRNVGVETPLAYVGLVPLVALLLVLAEHEAGGLGGHDRHVDYVVVPVLLGVGCLFLVVPFAAIVLVLAHLLFGRLGEAKWDRVVDLALGVSLLAAALLVVALLPVRMSALFWSWRMDLLSLPLFAAGAVTLAFGARALWRVRVPIAFLFLAWPPLYTFSPVEQWQRAVADATVAAVRWVVEVVPLARPDGSLEEALFVVGDGPGAFTVSVASACSGVNGLLGFLLLGFALLVLIRGSLLRKSLWLLVGLGAVWVLNVVRILLIFGVGAVWGESLALGVLHPFAGLGLFVVTVLGMLHAAPAFGLRLRWPRDQVSASEAPRARNPTPRRRAALAVPVAVPIIVLTTALVAVANHGLRDHELLASDLGDPRLVSTTAAPAVAAWGVERTEDYEWARRFFGGDSSWVRHTYSRAREGGATKLRSEAPVFLDVVTAGSLQPFSTYGISECYRFHGYEIHERQGADLGGGVTGEVLGYVNEKRQRWTALHWLWPIRDGDEIRYQRLVIHHIDEAQPAPVRVESVSDPVRTAALDVENWVRGGADAAADPDYERTRAFLVEFGRSLVQNAGRSAPAGS
jgi:exosortase/archaeosortase family protein